jgi:hypothetical protein
MRPQGIEVDGCFDVNKRGLRFADRFRSPSLLRTLLRPESLAERLSGPRGCFDL